MTVRGIGRGVLWGAVAVIVALVIGLASVGHTQIALMVAAAVLMVGILFVDPVLLIVISLPASLLMNRVGGILSLADVALAASTLVALVLYRGRGMHVMAPLLWAGVFYLATIAPTLILNRYSSNYIEFAHEGVQVLGSMVVGFVIGHRGRARQATSLFLGANVILGVATVFTGLTMLATSGSFGAVYLPEFNKNLIGSLLATAMIIVYARPPWMRLRPWPYWSMLALFTLGLFASQARQALIGAVVGLVVISLRRRPETGKRPKLVWFASIPVLIFVLTMVSDQLASDNQFNSSYQRLDWYAESFDIWMQSPVFGVGLRWWYTGQYAEFQPPNAELEMLTSVGVVGLIGFLAMFAVSVWALWRINPAYGTVGVAVVLFRIGAGQFDLYWVAGQASILWIIAGMCFGALAYDRAKGHEVAALPPPTPVRRRVRAVVRGGASSASRS